MGSAPPLLLLHGFTGSAEGWGKELLEALSASRRVLAVDLPGHGQSHAALGIPEVLDAIGRLLDLRGIEGADWVGYSMGGRIALAGALRHPDRVRRLVLESASPGIEDPIERARRRAEDEELAARIEAEGIEWFADFWEGRPLFASQANLPTEARQALRRRRLENRPSGLAGALRALGVGAQPSYWDALSDLPHPVLLLTGELDSKFVSIGAEMEARLPAGRFRVLPGVGHAVHLEAPEEWIRELRDFLG